MTDPAYGWAEQCQVRFGMHPVQVVHEWNTAVHVQQAEGDPRKRAFTVAELQAFFDHADAQVGKVRGGGRKGWLPVFRDAAPLKVAWPGEGEHLGPNQQQYLPEVPAPVEGST